MKKQVVFDIKRIILGNKKTILGVTLKRGTWRLVLILLLFIVLAVVSGILTQAWKRELETLRVGYQVYAATPERPFIKPALAEKTEREQNIALIQKIWGKNADIGLAIAMCESGYRTKAFHSNRNSSIDEGIFQINSVHNMPDMMNAVSNISYAYTMYLKQGVQPWLSSKICWSNL